VNRKRRRVAFVVHRYSAETFGGAERLAHALARELGNRFETELITTTARDYMTWANAYAPGVERIDGVLVRRFWVDVERDVAAFDRASRAVLRARRPALGTQERWEALQGPMSLQLLRYLADAGTAYDAVCFIGYLYATTYFGLPLVADRAVLLPLAHDEWMIRFSMWDRLFGLPRAAIYASEEERAFVERRFRERAPAGPVIGAGVTLPPDADAARFRAALGSDRPFFLYLGRIDPSKGCRALLAAYRRYRDSVATPHDLVLIGERQMKVRHAAGVRVLGPVDETTKWDALAAAAALVLPSAYESLSLAVLEAWAAGKPVIVNARADVLAGQVRRSGGGLIYDGLASFARVAAGLDATTAHTLGLRGAAYVARVYDWRVVAAAFAEHLESAFGWNTPL
jgi:glycosyltransferase involved in cell wall biosynthesis